MSLGTREVVELKQEILTVELRHVPSGKHLKARLYEPVKSLTPTSDTTDTSPVWKTRVLVELDSEMVRDSLMPGPTWLNSLLLAIEAVRKFVPPDQENEWLDEMGQPSWIVLPRTLDFSWGYDHFKRLASLLEAETQALQRGIEKRNNLN
jgi:hypothetical protein